MREACREHGIAAGVHCTAGKEAGRRAEAGFDMVTVGVDAPLLVDAVRRESSEARGEARNRETAGLDPARGTRNVAGGGWQHGALGAADRPDRTLQNAQKEEDP